MALTRLFQQAVPGSRVDEMLAAKSPWAPVTSPEPNDLTSGHSSVRLSLGPSAPILYAQHNVRPGRSLYTLVTGSCTALTLRVTAMQDCAGVLCCVVVAAMVSINLQAPQHQARGFMTKVAAHSKHPCGRHAVGIWPFDTVLHALRHITATHLLLCFPGQLHACLCTYL